jgi:tetratricopeptide (TPR) repeat protein
MAETELDALEKTADEENFVFYKLQSLWKKGFLYLEKNSIAQASNTAEEFKKVLDSLLFKKQVRWYFNLLGIIELRKNDFAKAIEYFESAAHLDPSPSTAKDPSLLDWLGQAYFKKGELGKAQQIYEKMDSQINCKWSGVIYAKSFYMLGKIAEQQGDKARASQNYRKFLDLWKDADPGLPEVEDARKRLAGLKGS